MKVNHDSGLYFFPLELTVWTSSRTIFELKPEIQGINTHKNINTIQRTYSWN